MSLHHLRKEFEQTKKIHESIKVVFLGVDGFDVYNPSIPFTWCGKEYLFGRVERRKEWARSWVRLFLRTGQDEWSLVPDSMIYHLEDPYITWIGDTLIMGGTHVRCVPRQPITYFAYFYQGRDLHDLRYFATGPDHMKDIRLVELEDGRIGVFSRPRDENIIQRFGCESQIGFTVIDNLDSLNPEVIVNAPYIPGIFSKEEWGGCNHAYLLVDGTIGMIGHKCYHRIDEHGVKLAVYMNMAFVFDRTTHRVMEQKIIGTRSCYPTGPSKKPDLTDCAFTSGIVMRPDGKADLYSGISDAEVGRIIIDDPFAAHGGIVRC